MADDDEVFALLANIVDAGHGERNIASVSEPRVHLELQLLSVHAGRLRMSYGRAVQMEHTERLKVWKLTSKLVLFPPTLHQRRWQPRVKRGGNGVYGKKEAHHETVGCRTREMNYISAEARARARRWRGR